MKSASTCRAKLRKLHTLIRQGRDETPEGEALRDSMDEHWHAMTPAEQHGVDLLSEWLYLIQDIRDFINELSAAQRADKRFRKKKYREANAEAWEKFQKDEAWEAFNGRKLFFPGASILRRKARINAALNLHHEFRGSEHRHKITADTRFWSGEAEAEVRRRFKIKDRTESEAVEA